MDDLPDPSAIFPSRPSGAERVFKKRQALKSSRDKWVVVCLGEEDSLYVSCKDSGGTGSDQWRLTFR